MITQQQVDEAKSLLLMIVNQAMARGLFNSIEDMPKVLDAVNLLQKLYDQRCPDGALEQVDFMEKLKAGLREVAKVVDKYYGKT